MFVAIGDAAGPDGLALWPDIVAAADSNNHAIPTDVEVQRGCAQLIGASLVEEADGGLRMTRQGRSLFKAVNRRRVGHITTFVDLAKAWRESAPTDAEPAAFVLAPGVLRQALGSYYERFDEISEGLRQTEARLDEVLNQLRQIYLQASGASHPHVDELINARYHPRTQNYLVASASGTLQDRFFSPANGDRLAEDDVQRINAQYCELLDEAVALATRLMLPAAGGR